MADNSASPLDGPHELLAVVRDVTRRVRVAQRATWFPLLVFAVITLVAVPIYRGGSRHLDPCRPAPHGTSVCTGVNPWTLVYWPLALMLAYAAIAGFYLNRSRRRGVGTRIRPYVVVGVALAVLVSSASWWRARHPLTPPSPDRVTIGPHHPGLAELATPAAAIGVALLVLAWVELNRALLAYSVAYLVLVLVQAARVIQSTSAWYFLPQLLVPAAALLLGSAGFAVFRPKTRPLPR